MIDGDLLYPFTLSYEPSDDTMISKIAAKSGRSVLDICYDLLLDTKGEHAGVLWRPLFGYTGNNDNIVEALELDDVIPGFDDAGAHCGILTDATSATTTLAYYGFN